jgi:hypothetical protein
MKALILVLGLLLIQDALSQVSLKYNQLNLGRETDETIKIEASLGQVNEPAIRYNHSTDKWQLTNDGSTWEDIIQSLTGVVPTSTTISTTAPLSGGGDLSANRTLSISQATTSTDGYLSSTDWNTFNNKVSTSRTLSTTAPLSGGGDLSANRTLSISQSTTSTDGYLSSTDWNTFNGKQNALVNSAGLASAISDETGTGVAVFSASPTLTGNPTAPTQAPNDNSTKIATTAYVDNAIVGGATFDAFNYNGTVIPYAHPDPTDFSADTWFPNAVRSTTGLSLAQSSTGTYLAEITRYSEGYLVMYKDSASGYKKLPDSTLSVIPGSPRDGEFSPNDQFFAVAHVNSPAVTIYERSGDTFTKLSDPASLPAGSGFSVTWSPDSSFLVVGSSSSPFITIYQRSGSTFTKLSDPASLPTGAVYGASWDSTGTYLSVSHGTSRYLTIYQRSGTTFTKLSDPASLPPSTAYGVKYSPNGSYLAVAHLVSPYLTVYSVSGTTYTKLTNPVTLPSVTCYGLDWSSDSSTIAVNCDDEIEAFNVNGSTITKLTTPSIVFNTFAVTNESARRVMFSKKDSTKLIASVTGFNALYSYTSTALENANLETDLISTGVLPLTAPAGTFSSGSNINYSKDGKYVSVTTGATPFVQVYERSGTQLDKLANPATLPTTTTYGGSFHPSNKFFAIGVAASPYILIYSLFGRTLTKLSDPVSLPTANITNGPEFSNSGEYLSGVQSSSPYINIYKKSGTTFTKLSNPASLPLSTGRSFWSYDDKYLLLTQSSTSGVGFVVYERSGDTFTKLADPATIPEGCDANSSGFIPSSYRIYCKEIGSTVIGTQRTLVYEISGGTVSLVSSSDPETLLGTLDIINWTYDNTVVLCGKSGIRLAKYSDLLGFTNISKYQFPTDYTSIDAFCDYAGGKSLEGSSFVLSTAAASTKLEIFQLNSGGVTGSPSVLHNYGYGMK